MSATMAVAVAAHSLVERRGARPSSLHAALADGDAWATACGERLTDGPRGTMHALDLPAARVLVETGSGRLCRRCDRAGLPAAERAGR